MTPDARALGDAVLRIVADYARGGEGCDEARFDDLARAIFAHQIRANEPYARYARTLGFDEARAPRTWREIPAVPSAAFKDAMLAAFDPAHAELEFHTSGTTLERPGRHFVERAALYDATLLAGFDRFMLADGARLRYLSVVPNPRARKQSSLGYMMAHVAVLRGDGRMGSFLDGDDVDVDGFARALDDAIAQARPVCIAGTAFGFVALLDGLAARGRTFEAPAGSRVMETGGFKGRTRAVAREDLYARIAQTLGIEPTRIVAEYGMTELLSQYYDSTSSRTQAVRVKVAPPWLRALVVDDRGNEVPHGEIGRLRHVDLANVGSVVAIDTEDRGYAAADGFVLLGREADAPPRGCSLDAEELLARRS